MHAARKSLLMLGAGLALAGFAAATIGLAGGFGTALILTGLLAAAIGAGGWIRSVRQRRADRYDLRRLFDAAEAPEEPSFDTVEPEAATVYCAHCDTAFDKARHFCPGCGRHLSF